MNLDEVVMRLEALEKQMDKHLVESILVYTNIARLQTDLTWVKWLTMGIAGGIGAIAIYVIKK